MAAIAFSRRRHANFPRLADQPAGCRDQVGLRFSASDAGATELILDGSSVGFAGEDGVAAKGLSLNPQNLVDRQSAASSCDYESNYFGLPRTKSPNN